MDICLMYFEKSIIIFFRILDFFFIIGKFSYGIFKNFFYINKINRFINVNYLCKYLGKF